MATNNDGVSRYVNSNLYGTVSFENLAVFNGPTFFAQPATIPSITTSSLVVSNIDAPANGDLTIGSDDANVNVGFSSAYIRVGQVADVIELGTQCLSTYIASGLGGLAGPYVLNIGTPSQPLSLSNLTINLYNPFKLSYGAAQALTINNVGGELAAAAPTGTPQTSLVYSFATAPIGVYLVSYYVDFTSTDIELEMTVQATNASIVLQTGVILKIANSQVTGLAAAGTLSFIAKVVGAAPSLSVFVNGIDTALVVSTMSLTRLG